MSLSPDFSVCESVFQSQHCSQHRQGVTHQRKQAGCCIHPDCQTGLLLSVLLHASGGSSSSECSTGPRHWSGLGEKTSDRPWMKASRRITTSFHSVMGQGGVHLVYDTTEHHLTIKLVHMPRQCCKQCLLGHFGWSVKQVSLCDQWMVLHEDIHRGHAQRCTTYK